MRKALAFVFLAVFCMTPLMAQNGDAEEPSEEPPIGSDWVEFVPTLYSRGDQTVNISVGAIFPTLFVGANGVLENNFKPKIGGGGAIGYTYFLSPHWYLGGEVGWVFAFTLGENVFSIAPFGLRFGYQFIAWRFEFPVGLMVGGAGQKYLNEEDYFGLIVKPTAAVFFRATPSFSFGINAEWWWVPQWPESGWYKRVDGHFVQLTLSMRYHF
ncbi:MAG: hypothetical protein LBJ41_06125 [Treponema sp.]|jgi:hypothetical protein|nr:hypothetical protein [Treponema sp.]